MQNGLMLIGNVYAYVEDGLVVTGERYKIYKYNQDGEEELVKSKTITPIQFHNLLRTGSGYIALD